MTWILILVAYTSMNFRAGIALTNVPGFVSEAQCKAAGDAASRLVRASVKELSYVCVQQGVPK